MQSIRSGDGDFDPLEAILQDINCIARSFRYFEVFGVRRNGNKVAHELARFVIPLNSSIVWLEQAPTFVMSLLFSDIP